SAGGSVTVKATDQATVNSNVTVVTASETGTDGGLQYANDIIGIVLPYDFSTDQKNVSLAFGKEIKIAANYDTNSDLFSETSTKVETLQAGDIVHVVAGTSADTGQGDTLYRYIGTSPLTVDLLDAVAANYTNTSRWAVVKGTLGAIYEYMGT